MNYPYKYPELYAELSRQGKLKKDLAGCLGITLAGLRYKQDVNSSGDFSGEEMKKASKLLKKSADKLFSLSDDDHKEAG